MSSESLRDFAPALTYPHIVVRTHAANYQRAAICLKTGDPEVLVGYRRSSLTHPGVDQATRSLTEDARAFLCDGVLQAVRQTGHRMCIVWTLGDCTFVEADGLLKGSPTPPSLGMRVGRGGTGRP